jgi:(1->4)-alpha-D-glucan 1-alpha-D-glucosylmutase
MEMNVTHKRMMGGAAAPDAVDEFMLYQTLASAWPLEENRGDFRERVSGWLIKALRESKRHTSWIAPNAAYEESCMSFLDAVLNNETFANDLHGYVETIAAAAALGSLSQTFLRLTTPGVPDLYQGCEYWDFSLVDPDNRRRIDFDARVASLARADSLTDALREWRNGSLKQRLIARVLHHRAKWPALYASGDYVPLAVAGARASNAIAFERRLEGARVVCVASRWALSLAGGALSQPLVDAAAWEDTAITLDAGVFVDVLHEGRREIAGALPVGEALSGFPVALYFTSGS